MFFRMIFGLPGAAIITALLFLAMGLMIKQDSPPVAPVEPPDISILAELAPTGPKPKPPTREKTKAPPPIEIDFAPPSDKPGPTPIDRVPGPITEGSGPIVEWFGTKPTIRIAPTYPENCRARGAQGVVMVEFDVTADGAVVNPRVIASEDSCLDRAALNTISKWKYTPKTDSQGRPVAQRGVRQSFNFQLTAAD